MLCSGISLQRALLSCALRAVAYARELTICRHFYGMHESWEAQSAWDHLDSPHNRQAVEQRCQDDVYSATENQVAHRYLHSASNFL